MDEFHGYRRVPAGLTGGAVAIGNFDGVHRGHQALLLETQRQALQAHGPAGAMVFEPHPRAFFRPEEPLFTLTPLPEKLRLLRGLKLDFVTVLAFDAAMARLTPEEFAREVLVDGFRVRHVVIGYDFYFGRNRAGTPDTMRTLGERLGFGVTVIAPVAEAGEVFSSSQVRAHLSTGDVRGAAMELGHWWRVRGVVTGGAKRGTGMGFPTANITLTPGTTLGHGIFAVRVGIDGERHQGAAYFGQRPTFDNGAPVLEVFLFDFDDNLYGREIDVEFIGFVRPDQRFADMEALKVQMDKDCARSREILAEAARNNPMRGLPLGEA
jgi:riboflavin kinase/FMN adenylyltransferase